jgi:AraC-like DNA-binding protein
MAEVSQRFPRNPLRAEVLLWDILWRIAELHESAQTDGAAPASVRRICEAIELHLVDRLDVRSLAERFGVSQNHLARLFKRHVGTTPARYIAGRRAHHAEHLLRRTTLPVKVVAGMVGFTDLHQFNKAMRRLLGHSPRAVRAGRVTPAERRLLSPDSGG